MPFLGLCEIPEVPNLPSRWVLPAGLLGGGGGAYSETPLILGCVHIHSSMTQSPFVFLLLEETPKECGGLTDSYRFYRVVRVQLLYHCAL